MKVIFRVESDEKVMNAFKNKIARFQSNELDKFTWFMFNNRHQSMSKCEIAEKTGISDYFVSKHVARLRQAHFMINTTGPRGSVSYQMIGIDEPLKATIRGLVMPKLNPLIEAVFC